MTPIVIACGSGGVGKTTTAAALALSFAAHGKRVAVLTIDPALRLADSLGIGAIGNAPVRVPGTTLDAIMLDTKDTFDGVIRRFAPTIEVRERILRNRYYRFVSTRLAGVHEYMAMEKLLELAQSGNWDVVVLDTPPTRHALDFLAAPDRMAGLMDEGVMRWLVLPASHGGWRMIEMGSEMLARVLKRLLGERTISEIAEFFTSFQGLWSGFRERSLAVKAVLTAPTTRFVLVTTPAPGARAEAIAFLAVLRSSGMPFGGFIVNRCARDVPDEPPAFLGTDTNAATLLAALAALLERRRVEVATQSAAIADLQAHAPANSPVWRVPDFEDDVHDLRSLTALSAHLPQIADVFS